MKRSLSLVLLAVTIGSIHARADDCGCEKMLASGVLRTKTGTDVATKEEVEKKWLCSADWGSVRTLANTYLDLGIAMPKFAGNLGYDFTEEQLNTWRRTSCSDQFRSLSTNDLRIAVEKTGDPVIVDGFNKCQDACARRAGGLICSLTEVSEQYLTFFLGWSPRSEAERTSPPLFQSFKVGGAGVFGGRNPLPDNAAIPIGGVVFPLERRDLSRVVVAWANTSYGKCESKTDDPSTNYSVRVSFAPRAKLQVQVTAPIQGSFNTNGDCGKNEAVYNTHCLPSPTAVVTNGSFRHTSQNCGSGMTHFDYRTPSANCAKLNGTLRGCGWRSWLGVKECLGNGWIGYDGSIVGYDYVDGSLPPYEDTKQLTLHSGQTGSVVISFPPQNIGTAKDVTWAYTVEVTPERAGRPSPPISLTHEQPAKATVKSTVSAAGAVIVEITNS